MLLNIDRSKKLVPSRWEPKKTGMRNNNGRNQTNIPRRSSKLASGADVPFVNSLNEQQSLGKGTYDGSNYGILDFKKLSESNNETVQKQYKSNLKAKRMAEPGQQIHKHANTKGAKTVVGHFLNQNYIGDKMKST